MTADDRVIWGLENAGATIQFDPTTPEEYLKAAGASGLGVAPTSLLLTGSVTGGATFRRSKRGSRVVTMPVVTFGDSREQVEDRLRALVRILNDRYTTPRLVATYADGRVFDTETHYSGGADHQWGSNDTDGRTFCRWVLQLTCPDPYFTARALSTYSVVSKTSRGLLQPGASLTQLRVSSAQALGNVTVSNDGDVEAWPTWRIEGPGSNMRALRPIDGASFLFGESIAPGNPVTIDTKTKAVTDSTGANRYTALVGAPKLFSLPPGSTTVVVELPNASSASRVVLSFSERRELIF